MLSFIIHKVALGKNYKKLSCFREAWALRISYVDALQKLTLQTYTEIPYKKYIFNWYF